MRVIITRPLSEARPWIAALQRTGWNSVGWPLIDIGPARQSAALHAAWQSLPQYDAVMFVSRNAVYHFFEQKVADSPVFNTHLAIKTRAYVTGPGSYSALQRAGVAPQWVDAPDLQAGQFDSEALWAVVHPQVRPGFRLLIVRGRSVDEGALDEGSGRDWFAHQMLQAGARVDFVVSYERQCPQWDAERGAQAVQAASDGSVWVFSSSEAVRNLLQCCPGQDWTRARAVVTHARIGAAAQAAGFGVVCESRPVLPALMASIESLQ